MSRKVRRYIIIIAVIALLITAHLLIHKVLYVQINDDEYCILSSEVIIPGYVGRTDVEKLSEFKRLKHLGVSIMSPDISFVKNHKDLKQLALWIIDFDKHGTDFTPLNNCKKIEEFGLTCDEADGAVIANMKDLRKLKLFAGHITNSSLIWECRKLEKADIDIPADGLSLKGIGDLDELNHLYLSGDGEVSDADELCECDSLTELGIVCEIEDTSFLTNMPGLEKLYIKKSLIDQTTINVLEDKNIEITFY